MDKSFYETERNLCFCMVNLKVNVKSVSNKQNKIKTIEIPYDENITDVRGLLKATVAFTVNAYNERRENAELLKTLTTAQIEDKAAQGKVSFGVNYGEKNADLKKATEDALEAFSDGVVVLFADEKKLENPDDKINIKNIQSLTFIKLTMLAGRMW